MVNTLERLALDRLPKILLSYLIPEVPIFGFHHQSATSPLLVGSIQGIKLENQALTPRMEMSAVVSCFNERAQKWLELHLASGFRKYFIWLRRKKQRDHRFLIHEGRELVTYAIINSIAMRKILKKYDKMHRSKQGQAFRSQAQSMHIETLKSLWLCELLAFYINERKNKANTKVVPGIFGDCSLTFDDDKPSLSCGLLDSVKLDIDLTCSICLVLIADGSWQLSTKAAWGATSSLRSCHTLEKLELGNCMLELGNCSCQTLEKLRIWQLSTKTQIVRLGTLRDVGLQHEHHDLAGRAMGSLQYINLAHNQLQDNQQDI